MGTILDVDVSDPLGMHSKHFLRVKVEIKLDQPLKLAILRQKTDKPPTRIEFKYERLSNFASIVDVLIIYPNMHEGTSPNKKR